MAHFAFITQVIIETFIIGLLLMANGVLAMAEMSLVSARKARLQSLAQNGEKSAATALELIRAPNQFLSTVQIGISLVGILAGAFGGATLAEWLGGRFTQAGLASPYANAAGLALVVLAITYVSLIIGELVPKRLALSAPERFACLLARPMRRLSIIARPAVRFLGWSTDLVLRLLGANRETASQVTGDEVRILMQEGQLAGVFHKAEPKMVERVLELDELTVEEIMTPRPNVIFLNRQEAHEHIWRKIVASRHSYFPVYDGDRDHVVGVVSVKSIYANLAANTPVQIGDLVSDPLFVPAVQPVVQLLESFRQSGKHFAVVVDEFGSVVGVVTVVDVLEAIVGDVPSQESRTQPEIRQRDDGTWLVDGIAAVEALEEHLPGMNFGPDDERSFQTLAGFVFEQLGRVPVEGDAFSAHGWDFEIMDMDGHRIDKVLLKPAGR